MQELADRIALKELIDKVSILADQKDFDAQMQLFTENAMSETIANGKTILQLNGRQDMAEAFARFNQDFDTVYHFNGQQVLTLNGNHANGICFCQITLIGTENGKKIKTTIGAVYRDMYVRENGRWLIAQRIGTFEWQEKSEVIF